jgi:hypothetical protein
VIINGGSRSNGAFFARHLMRADQNERVDVAEIRGLAAHNVRDAFREMEAVASGTRCKNFFYHANLNPREDEQLTPEQWQLAADTLERELGLTDQPRFVVEHEKEGRTHRHVVWSRIDADSMTAISDSLTYPKHERAAREIEQACGHEAVESVLVKDRDTERPERNPQDWESFRGKDSKLDPKAIKAEVTGLWQAADSGAAFAAALHEHGYILAKGDRRDFCIIDQAGDEHSLARRVAGVKAAEIRARMADIDRDQLPTVAEAREQAREATSSDASSPSQPQQQAAPEPDALPLPTPEITPEVERDLAARFEGWTPLERGAQVQSASLGRTAEAGNPALERSEEAGSPQLDRAAAADTSELHQGWRRFVDRVRAVQARAVELWNDQSSGSEDTGFAARLVDAGRKLMDAWQHPEGVQLGTGAGSPAEDSGEGDAPRSWVDRLGEQGRALWRSERGSMPGDAFDRMAAEWQPDVSPEEPPGITEPDPPQFDGPDIE